ncbi:DUF3997 domain-containing protein [Zobellia russellii]|uniref:DUF3997 domain-containing protein n=1 Tax=Zobellia russellii TaxID=248907 RepID=UPI001BFFA177|nr:DUF3997 domain-containing protein [Zobellia russellii]MBT9189350.1 DUF3997 domain-containing protein [Zobellia russellii]
MERPQISKLLLIVIGLFLINSCGLFDNGSDQIIGDYKIQWIDMHNTRSICKTPKKYPELCETLVFEYVFAVGHDKDYIIAKQHPTKGFENGYEVDTSITNCFIVDIKSNVRENRNRVIGPLNEKVFKEKVLELNIEKVAFDQTYPENPN